jgi:hypothetical protein
MAHGVSFDINANGSKAEKALKGVQNSVQGVTHHVKSLVVSAFGLYGVEQILEKTVHTAEELAIASKRLSIPVEQLQVLKQAAKESHVEFGKLQGVFEKINLARNKALGGGAGSDKLLKSFQRLGINKDDLLTKSAPDLLTHNIKGAVDTNGTNLIANQLKDVIGKSFGEITPMLQTDFEELQTKMQNLGMIMDTDTAIRLRYLGEEFSMLSQIIVTQAGPALLKFVDVVLIAIGKLRSVGSFAGGATSNISGKEFLKMLIPIYGWKFVAQGAKKLDFNAGGKAKDQTDAEWAKVMADFAKKMAEEAEKLKHPPKPDFTSNVDVNKKEAKAEKLGQLAGNDLLKIGGGLGQTDVNYRLQRLTESSNRFLAQIAKNTSGLNSNDNTPDFDPEEFTN